MFLLYMPTHFDTWPPFISKFKEEDKQILDTMSFLKDLLTKKKSDLKVIKQREMNPEWAEI